MMNDLSAPAHTAPIVLDATDQSIINLLRKDGRMPYRAIARELDIAENTVRARVRRMEETGTMRVVAVTDIEAAGYGMLLRLAAERDPQWWMGTTQTPFFGEIERIRMLGHILNHNAHHTGQISLILARYKG